MIPDFKEKTWALGQVCNSTWRLPYLARWNQPYLGGNCDEIVSSTGRHVGRCGFDEWLTILGWRNAMFIKVSAMEFDRLWLSYRWVDQQATTWHCPQVLGNDVDLCICSSLLMKRYPMSAQFVVFSPMHALRHKWSLNYWSFQYIIAQTLQVYLDLMSLAIVDMSQCASLRVVCDRLKKEQGKIPSIWAVIFSWFRSDRHAAVIAEKESI